MSNNILKSLPVRAHFDNQVVYASFPSGDNTNLTDAQYAKRLTLARSVNKSIAQEKKSIGNYIIGGIGIISLLGIVYLLVKEREKRKTEAEKVTGQIRVEHEKQEETRLTDGERLRNKLIELSAKTDNKLREFEGKQLIKAKRSNPINLVSEDPATWSRPCHKYIAIYNSRGKDISETRYDESQLIDGRQVFGDLVQTGNIAVVCGGSGVGKTQLLVGIGHCVADGKHIEAIPHKGKPIKMPVVCLSSEPMANELNKRFHGYQPEDFHYFDSTKFGTVEDCLDFICEKKQEYFPSDGLFIFDHVSSLFVEKMNNDRVEYFIKILRIIQEDYEQTGTLTFLFSTHPNKDGEDKEKVSSSQMSGSANWLRLVNTIMVLTASSENANQRFLQPKKTRGIKDQRNLTYVMELQENPVLHFKLVKILGKSGCGKGGKVYRNERDQIARLYQQRCTIPEIAKKLQRDPKTIRRIVQSLRSK